MKRIFSHVIKIALVLAMIICWVLSIGYTNRLTSVKNTFNIYFDEEEYLPADIYKMQQEEKDKDNPLAFTGWYEKEKQSSGRADAGLLQKSRMGTDGFSPPA